MKRESDCSTTSSLRKPRSSETASLAWRIFPSRSETNTGSGAFAMMMSATSAPRDADPSCCAPPFDSVLGTAELKTFLATGLPPGGEGAMRVAYSLCLLQVLGAMGGRIAAHAGRGRGACGMDRVRSRGEAAHSGGDRPCQRRLGG